jgi:hypothetical protein
MAAKKTKKKIEQYEDLYGNKYVLSKDQDAELVVGDYGWSPNHGYVIPICEDDDLSLINNDYYKVVPQRRPSSISDKTSRSY